MFYSHNCIIDMKTANIQKDANNDLCVTCKNFPSCMYVKSGSRPIRNCEEFEVHEFRPVIESANPIESDLESEELVYYGLCTNCGNRITCMNSSPDRIIWHCEEYV